MGRAGRLGAPALASAGLVANGIADHRESTVSNAPKKMQHLALLAIPYYVQQSPALATAGQPSEKQLASVLRLGFSVVINLGLHTDPTYALGDEAATVRAHGATYVHIPIEFSAPRLEQLGISVPLWRKQLARRSLSIAGTTSACPFLLRSIAFFVKVGPGTRRFSRCGPFGSQTQPGAHSSSMPSRAKRSWCN